MQVMAHYPAERASQNSSERLDSWQKRKAMMALAPLTVSSASRTASDVGQ